MLGIFQRKMEQNENGRRSSLGLLQTMTALLPKFNNATLICDDSLTIQPHKVILQAISTVSEGLLSKHQNPYPLVYVRGRGEQHPPGGPERKRGWTMGKLD